MVLFGIWPEALERAAPATGAGAPAAVADDRVAPRRSGPSPDSRPSALFPADAEGATAGFAPAGSGSPADAERSVEEVPDAVAQDRGSEVPVSEVPVAEVPLSEDPVAETPGTEEPVAGNVVTEVSANGSATRVFAGGEANLGLVFSGDCWVEIRDRDDRVVHRDLYRAGQVLELLGRAPFRVRLGYAPAVELSYNDSRVPLRPHTRNDVASLVIGR
jgi:cytoskeleton protein RodZ